MVVRILLGVVLLVAVAVRGDDEALAADYYVSPAGNDAWTGQVAQPDAARTDGPFATIQRAREAMRKQIAQGLKADVKVLIRGGTYYLRDGLTFGPEDSGSAEYRVTYAAYRDEVPLLIGGAPITGWTPFKGQIEQAALPPEISPRQLFQNGKRFELARTPDAGYFTVESAVAGNERQAFVYHAADLRPEGWDLTGAWVFCWPTNNWHSADQALQSIDASSRTITLAGRVAPFKAGNRFLVRNLLAALDRPGECQIDVAGRKVYVWKKSDEAIIASTASSLLAVDGGRGTVRNVHFVGLDLSISNGPAVRFNGAADCSIRACTIENAAEYGVAIQGKSERITVYGNVVRYHGRSGVALQGPGPSQPSTNHHNVVENNHIHSCGALVGHSYGVEISQSGHNKILHNRIHDMPRYGVSIKGPRYQILRKQAPGVTWENHYDFLHGRNNLIAFNHIHHVNQDSQDTGAFEAWGPGRDNVIDHNLIHDVGNREFDLQSGIYLDDAADHFTVSNNIIYNVVGTHGNQPVYAKGIGNRIINNIFIVHPSNDSAIRSYAMADERCDHHEYARNIIYFDGPKESARGSWGAAIGNLHDKGKTLAWKIDVPADGDYVVWTRYGSANKAYNVLNLEGRFTLGTDNGPAATLMNLPDTGAWGAFQWSRSATLRLAKGQRTLTWTNVRGGGLSLDGFVLTTDTAWTAAGTQLSPVAGGRHMIEVQAESHERLDQRRHIYQFDNYSDDRITSSDHNLFWSTAPAVLGMYRGPADGPLEKWQAMAGGKYDRNSIVADPMFVDPAKRDYRLRPESPALKLGFQPIDASRIGLKEDFPERFSRPGAR